VFFAVVAVMVGGIALSTSRVHAASQGASTDALIQSLLQQIEALRSKAGALKTSVSGSSMTQGNAPEHHFQSIDNGKSGRPKVVLTEPTSRASFKKGDDAEPIEVSWKAENVPVDAVVEVEVDQIKLFSGSVGGGVWQGEIPEGDSVGTYEWKIAGEGRTSPGTYRVRAVVRACHEDGCDESARMPARNATKVYAKSAWRPFTVTGDGYARESYRATLNGRTVQSSKTDMTKEEAEAACKVVYNDYLTYDFKFGDVVKCYWGGKKFETVDEWKG